MVRFYGNTIGPFAVIGCEPRQARKGAAVAVDSGAECGWWSCHQITFFSEFRIMSYQVLARQWRPGDFQHIVGQQHVVQALTNALNQQRLHHAYLFTGTRGTGKTTLARILAKCLNCEQGITATPCENCSTCQDIREGRCLDLLEIDAASRTGVEDMRELLDNVQYSSNHARYKVYIIDEVHMLSKHSFNALLKTLEEPPAHIIFILATTDPQKLPATVLSRCLQFHLKNLSVEQLTAHMEMILQHENISFEAAALEALAEAADGSVRDGLSLLDQTISHGNNQVALSDVQALLGLSEQRFILTLLKQLQNHQGQGLLDTITQLAQNAADFHQVLEQLLKTLHEIAKCQVVPEYPCAETIKSIAREWGKEETQVYYQSALIGRRDLPLAPTPRSGFEMIMLRMLAFSPVEKSSPPPPTPQKKTTPPPQVQQPSPSANMKDQATPDTGWQGIFPKLALSGMAKTLASYCIMVENAENQIKLLIEPNQAMLVSNEQRQTIEHALREYYEKPIKLLIEPGTVHQPSPFHLAKQAAEKKQQQAIDIIQNDPNVSTIVEKFDATIEKGSIVAID